MFNVIEIRDKQGVLHFKRWKIIETSKFGLYIHKIYKSDGDLHLHDHPWSYFSFILSGKGSESDSLGTKTLRSFTWAFNKASRFHKLKVEKPLLTLFIRGQKKWIDEKNNISDWGYLVDGKRIPHKEYRKMKREGKFSD